ncbi:MAG: cell division protein FtsA, partial [Clostridia bacterium]
TVSAEKANLVAKARIEEIAECIKACFADYEYEISAETPIYLTGGGLTYIKGGAEYLSQCLNKRVKIIPLNNPQTNKQDYVSTYGLLDIALRQQPKKESKFRFFK